MNYRLLQPGPMAACCYLVWDEQTGSAVLIDPGAGADALRRTLDTAGRACGTRHHEGRRKREGRFPEVRHHLSPAVAALLRSAGVIM